MATIQNAITMQDRMTPVFNSMIKAMQSTLKAMEQIDRAANNGVTSKAFQRAQRDIQSASNAVIRFGNETTRANQGAGRLSSTLGRLSSFGLSAFGVQAITSMVDKVNSLIDRSTAYLDNITLTKARLDLVNDGLQTTDQLQQKILDSANRARMSYDDMAKSVAKLNMLAGDQFGSNDEAISFVETLNKMFVVSGTGAQEASAAMYQLTQAMGAGKLQGDEFRSIMENAPMLAQAIADSMGKTKGELKEMSSEGLITADIIKKAMFDSADEINKKFDAMPKTFGQMMQIVQNEFMNKMAPVSQQFSEWLNSEQAQVFFDTLITGATLAAGAFVFAMELITGTIDFLHQVLVGIQPALVILGVLLLALGIAMIPTVVTALWGLITSLWAGFIAAIQFGIGMMFACWPITLAVILIALLIASVMALGVSFAQVVGFVVGLLYAFVAIVFNIVIAIINAFIILATFLYNVFTNPIAAIKMLFLDMATYIVDQIMWVAKALQDLVNMLPGVEVNFTAGLENIKNMILATKAEVAASSGVKEAKTLDYKDIGKSFGKGFNAGSGFINNISGGGGGISKPKPNITKPSTSGIGGAAGKPSKGGNKLNGGKLDEVGKINEDLKITDEDIKLLKDIATTQFVNSYTTLRPEMKVEFTGPINETADVDKLIQAIETMTEDALANTLL